MTSYINDREEFIFLIESEIEKKFGRIENSALAHFVRCYLINFPLEEWVGREISDLGSFIYGHWLTLQQSPFEAPLVKVFNPTLEEQGWLCGRTVVAVLQRDMPFLVDSIRIGLQRKDMQIHVVYSCVMNVVRNSAGEPLEFTSTQEPLVELKEGTSHTKEALIYIEISLHTDPSDLADIKQSLDIILKDVASAVDSYANIREKLASGINAFLDLKHHSDARAEEDSDECLNFLQWLSESHFTFLGFREFDYIKEGDQKGLLENLEMRLGVFEQIKLQKNFIPESDFSEGAQHFYSSNTLVCFSKSSTRCNVHRDVYPDYVVIKKLDENGKACGEVRFLGLYTYSVFSTSPREIPILRKKMQSLISMSDLDPSSHGGKNFIRIIENYPKEELFQSDIPSLFSNISNIAAINERHVVRLILRKDLFGSFVNCMVYIPRDVYSTRMRIKIENILIQALNASHCDSTTFFSESILARAQFVFKVGADFQSNFDTKRLESEILNLTKNWEEYLQTGLIDGYGEAKGISLFNQYKQAFPQAYQDNYDPRVAVSDIALLERLTPDNAIAMHFYQPAGSEKHEVRFKVFHLNSPIELSDVVPILENLGLRVLGENPFTILKKNGDSVWLNDFDLAFASQVNIDISSVRQNFEMAFEKVWAGELESDPFNRLVLASRLSWREVALLRAYAGYLRQIAFNSTKEFIANTLVHHVDITRNLIALFKANFEPRLQRNEKNDEDRAERLRAKILKGLDSVSNLNEDIVLRRYLDLINATLRTNYFQKQNQTEKSYISIKFSPRDIAGIPEPRPMFEIYVYSPRVEGVHLRGGKVARGGLRWSDRNQDFRTEVLGLVKAQQVKNAVIVPNGAKGGFVAKSLKKAWSRDQFFAEGVNCYKIFIKGLLDLTDNLVDGEIVPPTDVIKKDEDDPYLVVAADKGTATFSDIANEISIEYGHWLGDAFASGGSQGYDHKGMGITAKGAWVSVQRHFREKGIDIQAEDFSVVAIGDMAGDVFGNGMLLSEHICLQGAFNHLHIFVDPKPDAAKSFSERQRLFALPRSSWEDYDVSLISEGGGVFSRAAKSITITPQMQTAFNIQASSLTPNELITAMLKSPVDLIWNGGIGTYVKASWESHADVGDKANDNLRVDGCDLQCRVFGEGGNLGLTQLARVEYSLHGGACNTDFIDNAAGVDCSDHEVNIKILLDEILANGDLTEKQRNKLLADMTDAVSDLVLQNNYRQTFSISLSEFEVEKRINEYRRFINFLESTGRLNRGLEFLPSDEEIVERVGRGKALTRPELSVLISYAKVMLKEELSATDIADNSYVLKEIETAFPKLLREKYPEQIYTHRLKKEIVVTQVANDLINNLGITSAHRLLETTGASVSDIAKAYIVSRDVFQFESLHDYVKSLDNQVSTEFQSRIMTNMIRRVRRGTRWFLRNRRDGLGSAEEVETFQQGLKDVHKCVDQFAVGKAKEEWFSSIEDFESKGVTKEWAAVLSMPSNLFSGLGIVQASLVTDKSLTQVAEVFYLLLEKLSLDWFASQISNVKVETYWQAIARESFIDDLESQLRRLSESILSMQNGETLEETIEIWHERNQFLVERWKSMVNEVQGTQLTDYAMFSVALRELFDLAQATDRQLSD